MPSTCASQLGSGEIFESLSYHVARVDATVSEVRRFEHVKWEADAIKQKADC